MADTGIGDAVVNDDDSIPTGVKMALAIEKDGADSDDLQFVDDLNVEPEPIENINNNSDGLPQPSDCEGDNAIDTEKVALRNIPSQNVNIQTDAPTLTNHDALQSSSTGTSAELSANELRIDVKNINPPHLTTSTAQPSPISRSDSLQEMESCNSSQDATDKLKHTTSAKTIKHFIDGFTIEESSDPFPVHRSSLLTELKQRTKKKAPRRRTIAGSSISQAISSRSLIKAVVTESQAELPAESIPAALSKHPSKACLVTDVEHSTSETIIYAGAPSGGECEACTMCRKDCVNLCFYRGSPYCSRGCIKKTRSQLYADPDAPPPKRGRPIGAMTRNKPTYRNSGKCAKFSQYRPKSGLSDYSDKGGNLIIKQEAVSFSTSPDSEMMVGRFPAENGYESEDSLLNGSETACDNGYKRSDVLHWTISDVRDFIQALSGCERYGLEFEEQEIDGRALLLLNEDHLLNALDIKLGPALKIYSQINCFR